MVRCVFCRMAVWFFLVGCVWSLATIVHAQRTQPTARLGVILRFEQDASGKVYAVVTEVVRGSTADSAGVQAGDILLSVSGVNIDGPVAIRQIQRLLADGQPLSFVVSRGGKVMMLGAEPPSSTASPPAVWLGVSFGGDTLSMGYKGRTGERGHRGLPRRRSGYPLWRHHPAGG